MKSIFLILLEVKLVGSLIENPTEDFDFEIRDN